MENHSRTGPEYRHNYSNAEKGRIQQQLQNAVVPFTFTLRLSDRSYALEKLQNCSASHGGHTLHSDVVSSPQGSTYQSCRTSVRDFLTVKKCQQTNEWDAGLRGSSYFVPIMYVYMMMFTTYFKRCKYFKLKRVVRLVLLYTLERSYSFNAGHLEPKYPKTYCTISNIGVLHP